ncbi:MAG: response regulator transcription factor [Clostridia bacterium]|nr:response regulator transcription factor [Clostridia bacterium]
MKYDCLIIDDEIELANNTCEYLNLFGVNTYACYNANACEEFFKENDALLILLDINLSDGSGFDLCKELRKTKDIPILFISARNTETDKIVALNIGGDDYIEKPYSLGVLLAKVKVILKRYCKTDLEIYNDGNLAVDFQNKKILVKNNEVKLTALEFKLLTYLINNKNRLITKKELFENVWSDTFTQDGTLNVHIRKIREQIEENPNNPQYILTVWKEGYRFCGK